MYSYFSFRFPGLVYEATLFESTLKFMSNGLHSHPYLQEAAESCMQRPLENPRTDHLDSHYTSLAVLCWGLDLVP